MVGVVAGLLVIYRGHAFVGGVVFAAAVTLAVFVERSHGRQLHVFLVVSSLLLAVTLLDGHRFLQFALLASLSLAMIRGAFDAYVDGATLPTMTSGDDLPDGGAPPHELNSG